MSTISTSASLDREQIILSHLPQVKITATKLHRRCPPEVLLEDLVSAGVVGLLDACQRFDARRNLKFKTMAEHRIRGAMLDYLRQLDPLPRAIRRFQKERQSAIGKLWQQSGLAPSEQEVACELGYTVKRYRELVATLQAGMVVSLDAPRGENAGVRQMPDPTTAGGRDYAILSRTIEIAISRLPEAEHLVITALWKGDSHRTIARQLNITEGRISQIKQAATRRLRIMLGITSPAKE
jgi:RNA polymerase sigma factor for flagellar operon FliA